MSLNSCFVLAGSPGASNLNKNHHLVSPSGCNSVGWGLYF